MQANIIVHSNKQHCSCCVKDDDTITLTYRLDLQINDGTEDVVVYSVNINKCNSSRKELSYFIDDIVQPRNCKLVFTKNNTITGTFIIEVVKDLINIKTSNCHTISQSLSIKRSKANDEELIKFAQSMIEEEFHKEDTVYSDSD